MDGSAASLSQLLQMPVKPVARGARMRCLELWLTFSEGHAVRSVLAFRTDADRQGESNDVASWPARDDPRTRMLLPSLLQGLAAKLRFYSGPGVEGFTATVRRMVTFVSAKGYPTSWWRRPFALALLRVGVPAGCLPRQLRAVVAAS